MKAKIFTICGEDEVGPYSASVVEEEMSVFLSDVVFVEIRQSSERSWTIITVLYR